MFADNTLVYVTGESNVELEIKMNIAFIIVKENINKLKMNVEKYIIVGSIRKELRGNITLKCNMCNVICVMYEM